MSFTILINGEATTDGVPVTDSAVLRGDGCFEVLRAYAGRPLALELHLDRLQMSADLLEIQLPGRDLLSEWIRSVSVECPECAVRVVVTRGSALPGSTSAPLVIVYAHPWDPMPGPARLLPVSAPWHAAGADWDLAGAKLLSYAPNVSATRRAQREGFDDAILTTIDGLVLEGPTFTVAWVIGEVLETPTLQLGILDSITRRLVLEDAARLGIEVVEGSWPVERIEEAQEVIALSTIREVQQVSVVGEWRFPEGPVTGHLRRAYAQRTG